MMNDRQEDLDRMMEISENVLKRLADRYDNADTSELIAEAQFEGRTPLVYPAGEGHFEPEPRWVYMGECKYCGSAKPMKIFWKLTARTTRDGEMVYLPGTGVKVAMHWWPWAQCEGCGHQSRGEVTHTHEDP